MLDLGKCTVTYCDWLFWMRGIRPHLEGICEQGGTFPVTEMYTSANNLVVWTGVG